MAAPWLWIAARRKPLPDNTTGLFSVRLYLGLALRQKTASVCCRRRQLIPPLRLAVLSRGFPNRSESKPLSKPLLKTLFREKIRQNVGQSVRQSRRLGLRLGSSL